MHYACSLLLSMDASVALTYNKCQCKVLRKMKAQLMDQPASLRALHRLCGAPSVSLSFILVNAHIRRDT